MFGWLHNTFVGFVSNWKYLTLFNQTFQGCYDKLDRKLTEDFFLLDMFNNPVFRHTKSFTICACVHVCVCV